MNCSFVTVLTTESYLKGALVLHASLIKTRPQADLVALLAKDLSDETERTLNDFGIGTRRANFSIGASDLVKSKNESLGFPHWNDTFGKLLVFDMTEFEKIVYLDSDMMVLENIDELFALPHMSAVNAGRSFPGNSNWKDLNSGILVVEPRAGLIDQLTKVILELADYDDAVSDQNVLHYLHQDWPTKRELHLDEQYNIFDRYIDYYVKELGYGLFRSKRRISVVHFIGPTKPWMRTWTKQVRHMIWLARRLKYY